MIMPGIFKKKQFWGSIIAFAILFYILRDIQLEDIRQLLGRVKISYIFIAIGFQATMILAKGFRWKTIVEKSKKLPFFRMVPMFAAGQVINIVLPALTGQAGRIFLFARKTGLSKTFVFSTVVIEVIFDAISLLIFIGVLSTATIVFPREYQNISYFVAIATLLALTAMYLILHYNDKIDNFNRRKCRERWPSIYIGIRKFIRSFTKGISLLKSSQYFFRTLAFSIIAWLFHAGAIYVLFLSFGFKLPLISAVVIMVINTVALMIPITPGNAGTFELAVAAPLLAFKIGKADAFLFAMALHVVDFLPMMLLGSLFLKTEKMSLKEIEEEGEKDEKSLMEDIEMDDETDDSVVEEEKQV